MTSAPRCTVLTTVCDPEPDDLRACLASVRAQRTADWEHVLVDDGSTRPYVGEQLALAARTDARVRVVTRAERGGIVAAAVDALAAAEGDLIALLDHDDVLDPEALGAASAAFAADPECDLLYTDHDIIRPDGRMAEPFYKPDFSPERLRNQNYITHLVVARRSLVEQAGGFRAGFEGSQDHDLLLRLTERARSVVHLPRVLYHWRQSAGSVATDATNKAYAYEHGRLAVQQHCDRVGIAADVELATHLGCYRVRRRQRSSPLVSVIVPTRGRRGPVWGVDRLHAAESLARFRARTTYGRLEIVVVLCGHADEATRRAIAWSAGSGATMVEVGADLSDAAAFDAGVAAATGEVVLLLPDDTEMIEPDSIEALLGQLDATDVGVAGSKVLAADGTVRHAGYVLHGAVAEVLAGWPGEHPGPGRVAVVEREAAAVSTTAAALRRETYESIGGLVATSGSLPVGVGLSVALRAAGRRVVWTPFSSWYSFAAVPGATRAAGATFTDPYANPNLACGRGDWLEQPGRAGAPPYTVDERGRRQWA